MAKGRFIESELIPIEEIDDEMWTWCTTNWRAGKAVDPWQELAQQVMVRELWWIFWIENDSDVEYCRIV